MGSRLPQPLERRRRPDPPRRVGRNVAGPDGPGEARARAQQPLQLSAPLQLIELAEPSEAIIRWRTTARSRRLSTI